MKMKSRFHTNRRANIAGLYLEYHTSRRSVEIFAGNGRYNAHKVLKERENYYRERIIALWNEGAIVRALHEEG